MMTSSSAAATGPDTWMQSRFRQVAPGTLEIHRERAVERFLVVNAGGYWPVMNVLPNGRVVIVARTDDFHLGQRGRLASFVSDDGGESWSYPFYIDPRGPDDRNPAFGVTPDGVLLCAFYRADCYENGVYGRERGRPFPVVLSRSEDGGDTWSSAEPIASVVGESGGVFGRITITADGDLLMPYYKYHPTEAPYRETGFLQSQDNGRTWSGFRSIAVEYNESSILPFPDGHLLVAMRSNDDGHTALAESTDGGAPWTAPQQVSGRNEHPPDLLLLADGRVLLTYGRRLSPCGVRGMVSHDQGRSWRTDEKLVLVTDSVTRDCGYPSSVQLADGSILTAYYAVESRGFWPGSYGWHHGEGTLGPHCAVVKYHTDDLP